MASHWTTDGERMEHNPSAVLAREQAEKEKEGRKEKGLVGINQTGSLDCLETVPMYLEQIKMVNKLAGWNLPSS